MLFFFPFFLSLFEIANTNNLSFFEKDKLEATITKLFKEITGLDDQISFS